MGTIKSKSNDELLAMAKSELTTGPGKKKKGKRAAGKRPMCGELSHAIGVVRQAAKMIHDAGIRVTPTGSSTKTRAPKAPGKKTSRRKKRSPKSKASS